MKFFIDTHDRTKDSFPEQEVTVEQFVEMFGEFDAAALEEGVAAHVAHVNVEDGKAYCVTRAVDEEAVRRAHEKADFPFDSITEVKTVKASDLR